MNKILRTLIPFALAAIAVTSCGLAAKYAGVQQFQDGIYYKASNAPSADAELLSQEDFKALALQEIAREQAAKRDTVIITRDGYNTKIESTSPDIHLYYGDGYYFGSYLLSILRSFMVLSQPLLFLLLRLA